MNVSDTTSDSEDTNLKAKPEDRPSRQELEAQGHEFYHPSNIPNPRDDEQFHGVGSRNND